MFTVKLSSGQEAYFRTIEAAMRECMLLGLDPNTSIFIKQNRK